MVHGTCRAVPGTAWHVPCTISEFRNRLYRRDITSRPMAKKSKTDRKSSPKGVAKQVSKQGSKHGRRKPVARMSLANLTTEALAAELKRRRSELPRLEKQAAALRAELAAVLARIASLGGAAGSTPDAAVPAPKRGKKPAAAGGGRRTLNGKPTIGEHIVEILGASGSVLSPREIGDALGKRLSREVNTSFLVQISLTLARLVKQGRVNKVGRGQYSAASGASLATND